MHHTPFVVTRFDRTGLLWADDAAIVEQVVAKVYGDVPGAHVRVEVLSP